MVMPNLLTSKLTQLAIVGTLGLGLGAYLEHKLAPPTLTTTIVHDTKQVQVEVPVLTTTIVDRIVTDPTQQAAINLVMKENHDLKTKVTQLTSTIASLHSTGGTDSTPTPTTGTVVRTPGPDQPTSPSDAPPGYRVADDSTYHFKDWQLTADYSALKFTYSLDQAFLIESTVGKDSQGGTIGLVRLYQGTPRGLVPVPATTTVIQANPNLARWFFSPRIQGGLSVGMDKSRGGFVGFQVLKRGRSSDPKDISFSAGTVGIRLSAAGAEPLFLPLSFNLGHLPHQPFSNVWMSPSLNLSKQVGFVVSATF